MHAVPFRSATASRLDLRRDARDVVRAWIMQPRTTRTLVVRGDLGTGKSTLLASVAQEIGAEVYTPGRLGELVECHEPSTHPTIVLIDDVERIDPPSLGALQLWVSALPASTPGFGVIVAARGRTPFDSTAEVVVLDELDPIDVRGIISATHPGTHPHLVDRVVAEAGGNVALIAHWLSEPMTGRTWLDDFSEETVLSVPPRYRSIIDEFTEWTGAEHREILNAAVKHSSAALEAASRPGEPALLGSGPLSPIHRIALLRAATPEQLRAAHSAAAQDRGIHSTLRLRHAAIAEGTADAVATWADEHPEAAPLLALSARASAVRLARDEHDARGWTARLVAEATYRGDLALAERILIESTADLATEPVATGAVALIRLLGYGDLDAGRAARDRGTPYDETATLIVATFTALLSGLDDDWMRAGEAAEHVGDDPAARRLAHAVHARIDAVTATTAWPHVARLGLAGTQHDLLQAIGVAVDPGSAWMPELGLPPSGGPSPLIHAVLGLARALSLTREGAWLQAVEAAGAEAATADRFGMRVVALKARGVQSVAYAYLGRVREASARIGELLADPIARRLANVMTCVRDAQLQLALQSDDDNGVLSAIAGITTFRAADHVYPAGWLLDIAAARMHRAVTGRGMTRRLADARAGSSLTESTEFAARCLDVVAAGRDVTARLAGLIDSRAGFIRPFEAARSRIVLADLLAHHGRGEDARDAYAIAAAELDGTSADGWQERARSRSLMPPPSATATPHAMEPQVLLTAQEERIAALAAAGLSNKEIAQRLHLSPRTVGGHLYNIFPKLGIGSRAAMRDALLRLDRVAAHALAS
ncbi:helix-turn-helix transcriptional regulator [Microbacterium invictum]|uniref:DNA-binding CsgD family transcriptional regulator n=1 Tax=Microbacterium invictum TaxID=515415 RepID=A0AA40SRA6_9MICO|nr:MULTISPECIES: helix-turn-helix transcriptional regulator [Microbacterium]MBB4140846.1 DNA-binding CsgD family transcriptional regulator [Microbacterium invictum]